MPRTFDAGYRLWIVGEIGLAVSKKHQVVGVELTDKHINIVLATEIHSGQWELVKFLRREIAAAAPLSQQLATISREQGLGRYRWNLSLNDNHYQLLLIDVPDVPDQEQLEAIKLRASDLISLPLEEVVIEVIPLPEQAYHGRLKMAFIAVVERQYLHQLIEDFSLAGIRLEAIDIADHAMRNISVLCSQKQSVGILHVDTVSSQINLCHRGQMCLHRHLEVGLADLLAVNDDQSQHGARLQVDTMILEIQRSLDYFESQLGLGQVTEIIIVADNRLSDATINQLDAAFTAKVSRFKVTNHMIILEPEEPEMIVPAIHALGASLRYLEVQA